MPPEIKKMIIMDSSFQDTEYSFASEGITIHQTSYCIKFLNLKLKYKYLFLKSVGTFNEIK